MQKPATAKTLLLLLLAAGSASFGQQSKQPPPEPQPVPTMQVTDTIPTQVNASAMLSPYQCDADGNIYIRPHSLAYQFGWGQILKFNTKGENTTTFSGPADLVPAQYFVRNDGRVFILAEDRSKRSDGSQRWPPDVYLLRYKDDGSLDDRTKLDTTFLTSGSFVVFPSGHLLVSALELQQSGDQRVTGAPFTALLNESGRLLRRISAKDDDWISEAIKSGDETKVVKGGGPNPAVAKGQALIGSDGNAYIMRRSSPAVVYVISNAGELVRTLTLSSGDPPLFPNIMLEGRGQLAIVFRNYGPGEQRIRVFNERTGEEIQTARVSDPLGAAVACFQPPHFTFIRALDGKFAFYVAQAK